MTNRLHEALNTWNSRRSAELYCIDAWSSGYFSITPDGYVAVKLGNKGGDVEVKLWDILQGLE